MFCLMMSHIFCSGDEIGMGHFVIGLLLIVTSYAVGQLETTPDNRKGGVSLIECVVSVQSCKGGGRILTSNLVIRI